MSIRAIAAATDLTHSTIGNEVSKNGHLPAAGPIDVDVESDEFAAELIDAMGRPQVATIVNESGMLSNSPTPEALSRHEQCWIARGWDREE